jgi:hypothetical protein
MRVEINLKNSLKKDFKSIDILKFCCTVGKSWK